MAQLQPHHDGSSRYVSDLSPRLGQVVQVRVSVPHTAQVTGVHVRLVQDGEQRFVDARRVHVDQGQTWWQAELVCHNPETNYRFLLDGGRGGYRWLNGTGLHARDVPDAADFRILTYDAPPAWAKGAVVYQVFPDRFARDASVEPAEGIGAPRTDLPGWARAAAWEDAIDNGRDRVGVQVYGGTLDGVRERLDHLVDLGVTVLYLTPVFPGRSNHRYDAASFTEVDPLLGGTDALVRLQEACHERGIRVMGDLTTDHTGDAHEWFRAAQADPEGPEGAWYVRDQAGAWVTWLGVPTLPKLNLANPDLRAALFEGPDSVLLRWLGPGAGLDAWRVDVANMTGRYRETDVNHAVARQARRAVDEATDGDALLVADHVHDHSADVRGDGWHGVWNYSGVTRPVWTWLRHRGYAPKFLGSPLRIPRLGGGLVAETMREFAAIVPWRSHTHSITLLGSHDTTRVVTLVGGDRAQSEVAAGLLFTLPGIPMVTYGDEIGMPGDFGEAGRRPMPWHARGADPELWDEDLLEVYRRLVRLRRDHPALYDGGMRWLHAEDDALVFLREGTEQSALVHIARAAHEPVEVPAQWLPGVDGGRAAYGPDITLRETDRVKVVLTADAPCVRVWIWHCPAPEWAPEEGRAVAGGLLSKAEPVAGTHAAEVPISTPKPTGGGR